MSSFIESHEACCKIPTVSCPCPVCGNPGRKVSALTLDNHISAHLRAGFGDTAAFCLNPDCYVIYCNNAGKIIRKGETILPVTIKDSGEDVFVCYCFKFKRSDVRKDLKDKGCTDIPQQIKKGIEGGKCDCERNNPQGACCLGNVNKVIQQLY